MAKSLPTYHARPVGRDAHQPDQENSQCGGSNVDAVGQDLEYAMDDPRQASREEPHQNGPDRKQPNKGDGG